MVEKVSKMSITSIYPELSLNDVKKISNILNSYE